MEERNDITYRVCYECVAYAANGPDDSMTAERLAELGHAHAGLSVWPIADSEGEIPEPGFGRNPCPVCGDVLGGYRFTCKVVTR